jgi:hypothetical protein
MNGGRKPSAWNMFVKKVYHDGKRKNKNYSFKQALSDASKRKGEMGKSKKGGAMPALTPANFTGGATRRRSMALAGGKSRRRMGSRRRSMALA